MHRARRATSLMLLLAGASLAACSEPVDRTVIVVLTPDEDASLATDPGRGSFLERIEQRCPACEVRVLSGGTAPEDLARSLDEGADVVVVEALTSDQGEELVVAAGSVPLIAYDRFFAGADYYVAYDRSSMGTTVADAVSGELDGDATALLVDGSVVDTDLDIVERGLRTGLAAGGVEVAAELEARTGTAEETRAWAEAQLDRRGGDLVGAVVTMSDEQALGVVDALQDVGVPRPQWPVVTGAGADLAAVRRVITGAQSLSVHMPVTVTAERAADLALVLASGAPEVEVEGATDHEGVPAFVYDPVLVSRDNVTDVVVRDGTYTTEELCAGSVAAACERLGIR